MKWALGPIVIALAVTGTLRPAHAAMPGAIDDGGPEPGHGSGDPGPAAAPETKNKAGSGGGDAEPAPAAAPASAPSPHPHEPKTGPRHRIAVTPRFAYRLGDAGRTVTPASGFGLAGTYEFRYARVGLAVDTALGIDFAFDRFATGERGTCSGEFSGRQECLGRAASTFASTRVISETSFILVHTVAARLGASRPYLTLGAGLGVGFFDSVQPDLSPGNATDAHVLGRATIGIDVTLGRVWSATLRADYTAVRAVSPFATSAGRTLPLFGDLFDVGVGVVYSF